jgi:hypothetical protein
MAAENLMVVAAPLEVWVAPAGTVFPEPNEAPPTSSWTLLGTLGARTYSEAGVTVSLSETVASFTGAGTTIPIKSWRTDETLEIAVELADVTPQQIALVLDRIAVTHVTGTNPEYKIENLKRGFNTALYAILARGQSSLKEGATAQFQVYTAYQSANQAIKFAAKGGPALVAAHFVAIEAETGKFASYRVQSVS